MTREQLEHTIRAASAIANDDELYIVGSQSILGKFPEAPAELRQSMEVDIAPKNKPETEEMIEGAIGELSLFHDTFGYFVDGVTIDAIKLPQGWQDRLVSVINANTRGAKGLCLDPGDLAISKLWAAREKDIRFIEVMLREKMISFSALSLRIADSGFDVVSKTRLQALAVPLERVQPNKRAE